VKAIEKIVFLLIVLVLVVPAIQKQFSLLSIPELNGDFTLAPKPELSWESWNSGSFQTGYDEYLNDNGGFKNILVRITNQIDYSFYGVIKADGVVKGKNGHLYEYDYIRAYTGLDFVGEELIEKRINRLKFLQDHLKTEFDIDLIFILEPGKASCYPEYISDKYLKNSKEQTNYKTILAKAEEHEVNCIDLNSWFAQLKSQSKYPLYAQHGTHWSIYGMSFAADSILNLISHTRNINLRKTRVDTIVIENRARRPDYDMAAAMNLLFTLPEKESLAYPEITFVEDSGQYDYPNVLVVGDSYFWNIFNTDIPFEIFNNQAFWYFGVQVYPDTYYNQKNVDDLNVMKEVEKQDVILLMTTERFLYKFDWKFVDRLYALYGINSEYDKVYEYMAGILTSDEWFEDIIEKAKKQNLPVSEMLLIDAKYIYKMQEPVKYNTFYGIEDIEKKIRNDKNWLKVIKQKAQENNLSLGEMIKEDAVYALSMDFPESYNIYKSIADNKKIILEDSLLKSKVHSDAQHFRLSFDEMLQIAAEQMIKN